MTIGVAWIRPKPSGDELWFATDSRLSGDGNRWDTGPKLLVLPRRDAISGFAGATAQAYPLLLQIANSIRAYAPAAQGELEFTMLVGHLEDVVNDMLGELRPGTIPSGDRPDFTTPGDVIVIGGYSRAKRGMIIRALRWEMNGASGTPRWVFGRVRDKPTVCPNKTFRVFGDRRAASIYDYLLKQHLDDRKKLRTSKPLDLEPLEVLWRLLDMPEGSDFSPSVPRRPHTVAGPPQVVRLNAGGAATGLAVRWRSPAGFGDYLYGRRCLPGERLDTPLLEKARNGRFVTRPPISHWVVDNSTLPPGD